MFCLVFLCLAVTIITHMLCHSIIYVLLFSGMLMNDFEVSVKHTAMTVSIEAVT